MKTGIFETEHFEGAYPVIKLFDDGNNDIVIFTYEEPFRQFEQLFPENLNRYTWIRKPAYQSKYSFIRKIYKETKKKKLDVLYINGITDNFIFYAFMILFLRRVRVILTIHVINSYFEFKWAFSIRRIVRYIGRKMLLSVVKEFNVVSTTMVDHLQQKLPPGRKIHCIPGAVFEGTTNQQLSSDHPVNIVIPGSIDSKRRNYKDALALLQMLEERKIPAVMTLLGRFYGDYGQEIWNACKKLNLKFAQVRYYTSDTVEQADFDKVMNEAHLVFLPSVLHSIMQDGVTETYGLSVCSGNLFDVIKHAKPFIIPQELRIDAYLEKSAFRYTSIGEVAGYIAGICEHPARYVDIQQKALESSANFTIPTVRARNNSVFIK